MPRPYDVITFRGHRFDRLTVAAILDVERDLGRELNITQGSYNTSVAASGTTHAGGGAGDSMPPTLAEARREERALRRRGFMAYVRPELWRNGVKVWSLHVHWGLMGNRKASAGLRAQFAEYLAGGDGLVGSARDTGPREFVDVRYRWQRGEVRIARARRRIDAALNDLAAYNTVTGTGIRGYAVGATRKALRKARAELPNPERTTA